jgi:transposase-like protein
MWVGKSVRVITTPILREFAMNPQQVFCPHPDCKSRGCVGAGNIGIKSQKQRRYVCKDCGHSFAETKGTPLFGLKKPQSLFMIVILLLTYGCPPQAIVAAFGLHERTVFDWQNKAGGHCEQVHEALVEQPRDLVQVQADEIRVKFAKKVIVWMAMAVQVPTRLWLGGVLSVRRDQALIDRLAAQVKRCALPKAILLATDGLVSYVKAWQRAFRTPVSTGKRGRRALLAWPEVVIGQVIKRHRAKRLVEVEARLVQGEEAQRKALSLPEQKLHSSYIERLNATFRARLHGLVRRGRALFRQEATLQAGMYLVGTFYNFCSFHDSLRLEQPQGRRKWIRRTPAMVAGITDHGWSPAELLTYKIAPAPYVPPKRRGRKPKQACTPAMVGA